MDEILYREEMMWLRRSCIAWLKEGDTNTKNFHMKSAGQAKKNKIRRLRKDDGVLTHEKKELEQCEIFRNLYQADPGVQPDELLQLYALHFRGSRRETMQRIFRRGDIKCSISDQSVEAPSSMVPCEILPAHLGGYEGGRDKGCAGVLHVRSYATRG
jgi:hypothetical protein